MRYICPRLFCAHHKLYQPRPVQLKILINIILKVRGSRDSLSLIASKILLSSKWRGFYFGDMCRQRNVRLLLISHLINLNWKLELFYRTYYASM